MRIRKREAANKPRLFEHEPAWSRSESRVAQNVARGCRFSRLQLEQVSEDGALREENGNCSPGSVQKMANVKGPISLAMGLEPRFAI
jgi:hypothetical protein